MATAIIMVLCVIAGLTTLVAGMGYDAVSFETGAPIVIGLWVVFIITGHVHKRLRPVTTPTADLSRR
jgi:succinate dehydrogenase hydrophobic anchor subunit